MDGRNRDAHERRLERADDDESLWQRIAPSVIKADVGNSETRQRTVAGQDRHAEFAEGLEAEAMVKWRRIDHDL